MSGTERTILVGFGVKPETMDELKMNLEELEELARSAGAEVVGSTWQLVEKRQPATLLGTGKVDEIKAMIELSQAQLVVVDHTLSGVQSRNLEQSWGVRVLDRNQLILDIFAQRAQTYEGKLQVELAQLLDQMPRMVGAWLGSLSRLGGGIGTRGPGEKAIELDRRQVQRRMDIIRKRLEKVRQDRQQHRQTRKKQKIPAFALIGYTNSGKSTLLNVLTQSNVLSQDMVFATLDPVTRKIHLDGPQAVITDTVGFIHKLPPQLVEAFKSTLEESGDADILIHVIDLSNPNMDHQVNVVNQLIREFGWQDKPILHVFNKTDLAAKERGFKVDAFPRVFISAKNKEGIDLLKMKMAEMLGQLYEDVELYFSREDENKIFDLAREAQITRKEPASQGTVCRARLTPATLSRWSGHLVKKED